MEQAGYPDLALPLHRKAAELGPDNLDVLIGAAAGLINLDQLDEAETLLRQARSTDRFQLGTESIEAAEDLIRLLREPAP